MRNPKRKIDVERLNSGSFTIADAMGLSRGPARPAVKETPRADTEPAPVSALETAPLRLFLERKGRSGKTVTRLAAGRTERPPCQGTETGFGLRRRV